MAPTIGVSEQDTSTADTGDAADDDRGGVDPTRSATKQSLRETASAARRGLSPAERREASQRVVRHLLRLPALRRPATVLVYAATPEEVELSALVPRLHERGARTLFPRIRDRHLELVAAADVSRLALGRRGIREPPGPAVDPDRVDVAVVPGVAFDPHGGRLGRGGGHYDRLLPRLPERAVVLGVCFACQVVPRVPMQRHDVPVDVVVTERAVYRPACG